MPSLFDPQVRTAILDRVSRLTPERRPVWGRFTAPEMMCHVSAGLRQGLGELDAGPPSGPFARFPLNWLVIHVLPWPKGKGKSPREFLVAPSTWSASRVFGRISGSSWGVLEYKHLDHHLRQFGV